jgi:GR25 family glycosyltransferase involved in LPS biosynthesis
MISSDQKSSINCPFFILHYKKNTDRREQLKQSFAAAPLRPIYIEQMDQGEFVVDDVYRYDEASYIKLFSYIKDNIVGTAWGSQLPELRNIPWANCIQIAEQKKLTAQQVFALYDDCKPHAVRPAEVSLILKHQIAYRAILAKDTPYAIVAEDDVVFQPHSWSYLAEIIASLPPEFDWIDLAGGLGLSPRPGNSVVNAYFFQIDPPRTRSTCCAIVHRSLAERMLEISPPFVGGWDWMLNYVFRLIRAKVYWVAPLVFIHGSEAVHRSNMPVPRFDPNDKRSIDNLRNKIIRINKL